MAGKRSILKGHEPGSVLRFCLAGGLGAAPPDWQRRGLMSQSARSPYRERRKHLPMPVPHSIGPAPKGPSRASGQRHARAGYGVRQVGHPGRRK